MRVDEDEIRGRGRPAEARIGRLEWFGIITLSVMIGGLLHDGARMLIANAWANYQLEQFQKEMGQLNKQMHERRMAEENAKLRAAIEAERVRKLRSPECKFWMQQSQQNPSQKHSTYVSTYCQ